MNDHLAKPIEVDDLYGALVRWLAPRETEPGSAAVERPDEGGTELPQHLPGIDVRTGLRRVGGNTDLYRRLLVRFVTGNRDTAAGITAAIAGEEWEQARAMVHAVKGVVGNLGAVALFEAAGALEQRLQKKEPPLEAMARFTALFEDVLGGLAGLAVEKEHAVISDTGEVREVDTQAVAEKLARLAVLLESDLGAALDCVEELQALLADTILCPEGKKLATALAEYDSDTALTVVRSMAASLTIDDGREE